MKKTFYAKLRGGFVTAIALLSAIVLGGNIHVAQSREADIGDYQLNSGDRISIRVYGEDDLSMEALLDDSGVINYPFIGEIEVAGMSLPQLEKTIISGLKGDYLVDPSVEVSIVEYRPFFINGEVNTPGSYPFQPGLTINKAVAMASGFTVRASEQKITIERGDGKEKKKFKASMDTRLYPGDVITVEQGFF